MKTVLVSDSIGLGIMEVRPEPAWRVRMTTLRNKDLLAPEYGAMHVAAYLKGKSREVEVLNLVADVHRDPGLFREPNTDPQEASGSLISRPAAGLSSRNYLFDSFKRLEPDVILLPLSVYNLALYSRELMAEIKEYVPGSTLVAGGIYSTIHPDEILADGHADVVVRGEGEITTVELLDALEEGRGLSAVSGISYRENGRVRHNPPRERIAVLDSLPHPYTVAGEFNIKTRFDILSEINPVSDYIPGAGFLTSRGCPEACSFCLDPAINERRTRFHSPEYVREVLQFCSTHFPGGSSTFFFGDATFTMNKRRMGRILDSLAGLPYSYQIQTRADYLDERTVSLLAGSGFTNIAIGAESFNQKVLEEVVHKRLDVSTILEAARSVKRAGMDPVLTFIVGLPGEGRKSVERTIDILRENRLLTATFFPLVVFKGTELFELFKETRSVEEMEALRLNPKSEEYLFTSDEFPTMESLTSFTEEVNREILSCRGADGGRDIYKSPGC